MFIARRVCALCCGWLISAHRKCDSARYVGGQHTHTHTSTRGGHVGRLSRRLFSLRVVLLAVASSLVVVFNARRVRALCCGWLISAHRKCYSARYLGGQHTHTHIDTGWACRPFEPSIVFPARSAVGCGVISGCSVQCASCTCLVLWLADLSAPEMLQCKIFGGPAHTHTHRHGVGMSAV